MRLKDRSLRITTRRLLTAGGAGDAEFLQAAARVARAPVAAVLLSGGAHECSRYSMALSSPFMTMAARGSRIVLRTPREEIRFRGDPLDFLDEALASVRPDFPRGSLPFAGGAAGYFAYNLKNMIERLPRKARADPSLPDLFLFWPRLLVIHDRAVGSIEELLFCCEGDPGNGIDDEENIPYESGRPRCGTFRSNFDIGSYVRAVQRIRQYIRQGDVYQVNLSQRFTAPFQGDPFPLFRSLFERNPAPFYAYIRAGDHQIVSTSMERFLALRDGIIESRPIKGTRPRGDTETTDRALASELMGSAKDDAELSMIVDLIRNDLGKVCETGSVCVREHKRLETYATVHHLVSVVTGRLRAGASGADIMRAAFPGGSITGCPRIRAMEIIDELEPHARHVYTGAIGYVGLHGTLDLNVAIRTAMIHRGACAFSVGGGVVYDSDPEDEYRETLHKGRAFFETIQAMGGA